MIKYQPRFFPEHDQTELVFSKPCKHNHAGPDGQGIRRKYKDNQTQCLACIYRMPPGPFEHQFNKDIVAPNTKIAYTPEESRQRHIQQVMAYHKRNPDKLRSWIRKYEETPERKEAAKKKNRENYVKNREEILARNKENYYNNKEEYLAKRREFYHNHKKVKDEHTST